MEISCNNSIIYPLLYRLKQSEASRNCFSKICHLKGKGYFAAVALVQEKLCIIVDVCPRFIKSECGLHY